jgi:hypothetical protein
MTKGRDRPPLKGRQVRRYADRDDVERYLLNAWANRPHRTDVFGWPHPVTAHTATEFHEGRSPTVGPGPDRGMLDILLSTRGSGDGAGVLLIDGDLVAAGDGRYQVEIEPGRHIVEVQGREAAQAAITIVPGERVCLTTDQSGDLVATDRHTSPIARIDRLERLRMPESRGKTLRRRSGIALLLLALLVYFGGIVYGHATSPEVAAGSALRRFTFTPEGNRLFWSSCCLAIAVVVPAVVLIGWDRVNHRKAIADHLDADLGRDEHCDVPGSGPAVHIADGVHHRKYMPPGASGVLVKYALQAHRVAADRQRESVPDWSGDSPALSASYVEPPRANIDGVPVPCSWGTWFYALPPGGHRIAVRVSGAYNSQVGEVAYSGEPDMVRETTVTVEPGQVVDLRVLADVYRVWRPGEQLVESFTPRLELRAR